MITNRAIITSLIFLVLAISVYFSLKIYESNFKYNKDQEIVLRQERVWSLNKPESYEYKFWQGCMFSNSYKVIVKNGEHRFTNVEAMGYVKNLSTISDVFAELITAYKIAKSVEVKWSKLGYPEKASIDWSNAIDDECGFHIYDFTRL